MKILLAVLVPLTVLTFGSCDRHPYSETSQLLHHGDHGDADQGHPAGHSEAAETHAAEGQKDDKKPKRFFGNGEKQDE